MDRDRSPSPRGAGGQTLGKRQHEQSSDRDRAFSDRGPPPNLLHFRLLVPLKKAGCVIGKGGDFIQMTKSMTGAKVGVDKAVGQFDERLVHVQGFDEPSKPVAGVQEAVLRTAERILGEEVPGGPVKLPHKCVLRMLLFKFQIGAIMGKKGAAINDIRSKSGASVKLLTPTGGMPIVPPAEHDDELMSIVGGPEQVLSALKLVTDKLRPVPNPFVNPDQRGPPPMLPPPGDNKRSRMDRDGPGMGPPPHWDRHDRPPLDRPDLGPPPHHHLERHNGGGPPPGGAIGLSLPYSARGVLANNDSVKTEGLAGLATVEYRILVPLRRNSLILGSKGQQMLNDVRARSGARVQLFDEERDAKASDRILQVMSTEDVQDQHCAAFDAAMDCIHSLVRDELAQEPTGSVRLILPHGQVGAVMGKGGSTINALRMVAGCSIHISSYPDVPRCVKKGEEVLEMRGPRDAVLLASHVVLVAVRGNMARGQLIYNYPPPSGAPPPTMRLPPGGLDPRDHRGDPYGDPRDMHGHPPGMGPLSPGGGDMRGAPPPSKGSRWDSDGRGPSSNPQGLPPPQVQLGLPGAPVLYDNPPGGLQYGAPPHMQQGLPPQQQGLPPPQVQYVQQAPGLPPPGQGLPPQQVVVYANQPGPGGPYAPPPQIVQGPAPGQPVEYAGGYMQQQPPPQQQQQQPGGPPPMQVQVQMPPQQQQPGPGQPSVVYSNAALPAGQAPQYMEQVVQGQLPGQPQSGQHQQQQVLGPGPGQGPPQQQHITYIYTSGPLQQAPQALQQQQQQPPGSGGPGSSAPPSGPPSNPGYGGLGGLVGAVAAATGQQPPPAAPAPAPAATPLPPKARVLLTQEQVERLRLNDTAQTAQLSALSGATITLSEHVLDSGAREVLLAGTDVACNTAKNLMEALMRSG